MKPGPEDERNALGASIVVATVIGLVGLGWGLATGSQLIVLDGAYAFVGVAVSWLMLLVSRVVGSGPSRPYPYGREALTPLVVGIQGFVLLGTLAYAAVGAVMALSRDVDTIPAGWALAYGVLSTVVSLGMWRRLQGGSAGSDLVASEAAAWQVSAYLGVGMVVAFGAMIAVEGTAWSGAARYVDPVTVLTASVLMAPTPLGMVRSTFVEMLEGAPPQAVRGPVMDAIAAMQVEFGLREPVVRMTKLGAKLYVEVDGAADPATPIEREHELRRWLEDRLAVLPLDVWLNFELFPDDAPADER